MLEDGSGEPSISSLSDLGDSLLAEMGGMKKIQNPHEFDITPAQVMKFIYRRKIIEGSRKFLRLYFLHLSEFLTGEVFLFCYLSFI